jgi:hypothetical protein
MSNFWESLKKNVQEGIHTVSEKTDELTRIGRLKIEIIAVKRDIEKSFIELGGRVYELLKSEKKISLTKDQQINTVADKISGYEDRLHQLEEDVEKIQQLKSNKTDKGD